MAANVTVTETSIANWPNGTSLGPNDLALALGATEIASIAGATAAEITQSADVSAYSQAITAAAAITLTMRHVSIVGPASSTYAITLAAPTANEAGRVLVIRMTSTTGSNAVTLALTNVLGGTAATSASFDAANETLVLVAAGVKWVVLKEHGVTLS
jgi:hypothetical protein